MPVCRNMCELLPRSWIHAGLGDFGDVDTLQELQQPLEVGQGQYVLLVRLDGLIHIGFSKSWG
eukprot:3659280-Alexandrium_andersonii.AAC.1